MGYLITRRLVCLGFGLFMSGAVFAMPAQASESDPQKFLSTLAREATTLLSDDGMDQAERAAAFRGLLRRGFDVAAVSRFVLGRYWRRASEPERIEFSQLFEDYIVANYGRRLGSKLDNALKITGHRADGPKGAIVHSQFGPKNGLKNGTIIKLDWRLRRRATGWRVVDIMVEGVSMALAQRSEFATVIRSTGGQVAGLLVKLRKKTQTLALYDRESNPTKAKIRTQ
jgi:phospholipid transport system substrate-binding protein